MNNEKLEREHAQLKESLAELVDFINSEEYYRQSDVEKQLIATQRTGMETYLNALSLRLWGDTTCSSSISSILPLLMSTMILPSLGSTSPSATYLKEELEKDGVKGGD